MDYQASQSRQYAPQTNNSSHTPYRPESRQLPPLPDATDAPQQSVNFPSPAAPQPRLPMGSYAPGISLSSPFQQPVARSEASSQDVYGTPQWTPHQYSSPSMQHNYNEMSQSSDFRTPQQYSSQSVDGTAHPTPAQTPAEHSSYNEMSGHQGPPPTLGWYGPTSGIFQGNTPLHNAVYSQHQQMQYEMAQPSSYPYSQHQQMHQGVGLPTTTTPLQHEMSQSSGYGRMQMHSGYETVEDEYRRKAPSRISMSNNQMQLPPNFVPSQSNQSTSSTPMQALRGSQQASGEILDALPHIAQPTAGPSQGPWVDFAQVCRQMDLPRQLLMGRTGCQDSPR